MRARDREPKPSGCASRQHRLHGAIEAPPLPRHRQAMRRQPPTLAPHDRAVLPRCSAAAGVRVVGFDDERGKGDTATSAGANARTGSRRSSGWSRASSRPWPQPRVKHDATPPQPHPAAGLARRAGRDDRRAHEDVQILIERGLVERGNAVGVASPFDEVHIDIRLHADQVCAAWVFRGTPRTTTARYFGTGNRWSPGIPPGAMKCREPGIDRGSEVHGRFGRFRNGRPGKGHKQANDRRTGPCAQPLPAGPARPLRRRRLNGLGAGHAQRHGP